MQPSPAELAWQIALNNLELRDAVAVLGAMLHAPALLKSVQPVAAVVREQYLREVDRALAFGLCWSSVFWRQPLKNFHSAHLGSVVSHCLKTPGLDTATYIKAMHVISALTTRDLDQDEDYLMKQRDVMMTGIFEQCVHVSLMRFMQGYHGVSSQEVVDLAARVLYDCLCYQYDFHSQNQYANITRELAKGVGIQDIPHFLFTSLHRVSKYSLSYYNWLLLCGVYVAQSSLSGLPSHDSKSDMIELLVENSSFEGNSGCDGVFRQLCMGGGGEQVPSTTNGEDKAGNIFCQSHAVDHQLRGDAVDPLSCANTRVDGSSHSTGDKCQVIYSRLSQDIEFCMPRCDMIEILERLWDMPRMRGAQFELLLFMDAVYCVCPALRDVIREQFLAIFGIDRDVFLSRTVSMERLVYDVF